MNAIPADVGSVHAEADYAELRREVLAAGLLDRAYGYYLFRAGSCFAMLAAAIVIALVSPPTPAWLIVSAALLGFCIVQVALIGHDAGHREVFRSPARNDLLGLACWSLVAGVAFWYWNDRHNAHHGHTNDPENDPDIQGGGLLAFTEEEARDRTGWRLLALRHQGLLIWLSAGLLALWFRLEGIVHVLRELRGRRRATELALVPLEMANMSAGYLRDEFSVDARIKWPNDIVVGGRKIAGLLIEARVQDARAYLGIGVGVNAHAAEIVAEARFHEAASTRGERLSG